MMAIAYGHVYVAQVSLGANPMQAIKAMKEAESYDGPSLIICYAPCANHGIKGGLSNAMRVEKLLLNVVTSQSSVMTHVLKRLERTQCS